jgi:hypothetical protein
VALSLILGREDYICQIHVRSSMIKRPRVWKLPHSPLSRPNRGGHIQTQLCARNSIHPDTMNYYGIDPLRRPRDPYEAHIAAAWKQTRFNYHIPVVPSSLNHWAAIPCSEPYIAARVQSLQSDNEQTIRHYNTFYVARLLLPKVEHNAAGLALNEDVCKLDEIYVRVLKLYKERLAYIHAMGMNRFGLWARWFHERAKFGPLRNEALIAACESTINFEEDDYVARKLDFVEELYFLLETHDPTHAQMVLNDLEAVWPWTKDTFIMRLQNYVVDYSNVKLANHNIVRSERYYAEEKFQEGKLKLVRVLCCRLYRIELTAQDWLK